MPQAFRNLNRYQAGLQEALRRTAWNSHLECVALASDLRQPRCATLEDCSISEPSTCDVGIVKDLVLQAGTLENGYGQLDAVGDIELAEYGPKVVFDGLQR